VTLPATLVDPFREISQRLPTVQDLRTAAENSFHIVMRDAQRRIHQSASGLKEDLRSHGYIFSAGARGDGC